MVNIQWKKAILKYYFKGGMKETEFRSWNNKAYSY